jgi:multisubunit Na+/H+ antiporter MnhC subunit
MLMFHYGVQVHVHRMCTGSFVIFNQVIVFLVIAFDIYQTATNLTLRNASLPNQAVMMLL